MAVEADKGAAQRAASGSSFYLAMRLLPREKRDAMYAIYCFCRAVDDIADDAAKPRAERTSGLDAWRIAIDSLYSDSPLPSVSFLLDAKLRYMLRKEDFVALIDGMAMDAEENICGPELSKLDSYCDRVASAVGRLSIKVFGMDEEQGFRLAHHLGRALQLTNILRDVDEDAGLGRLYLPREFLEQALLPTQDPVSAISSARIDPVCRGVAEIAHRHYHEADAVMRTRPLGDLRPPKLMSAAYSSILREMEKVGWAPPRLRASLPKSRMIWLFLRHGLGG
jgi:squalene synthase HpnD